jgi:hypothetical protein
MTDGRIEGRAATRARDAGGWSLALGAVVASMLLIVVACGGGAAASSGAPVAVASPSVAMASIALTSTPVASVAVTDALTSSWATGKVTCAQEHAVVIASGFIEAQWRAYTSANARDAAGCPAGTEGVREVRFQNGQEALLGPDGSSWDNFAYAIVDDHTFIASYPDHTKLTWHFVIQGQTLKLTGPSIDEVRATGTASSEADLISTMMSSLTAYQAAPFVRQP